MNFEPYLVPSTKVNWKWIIDQNVKTKTTQLLKTTQGKSLWFWIRQSFFKRYNIKLQTVIDKVDILGLIKIKNFYPGWCSSVNWAQAWEPKGHQFDSQSEHTPGLQARFPVGGAQEATIHWCFPLSFPPPSLKMNK